LSRRFWRPHALAQGLLILRRQAVVLSKRASTAEVLARGLAVSTLRGEHWPATPKSRRAPIAYRGCLTMATRPAQRRDRIDDAAEAFTRPSHAMARAQIAMNQSGFFMPESLATGREQARAIDFAVARQRVAFGGDDDGRRQIGEIYIL